MSLSAELDKLAELHRQGVLSDDEFARAKARVLGDTQRVEAGLASSALNALRRSRDDRWLGGVCAGLARVSGLAAWIWRLAFVLLLLCGGTGAFVYLLLWLLVPDEPASQGGPSLPAPAGGRPGA